MQLTAFIGTRSVATIGSALFVALVAAQLAVSKQRACDIAVNGPCCLLTEAEAGTASYHASSGVVRSEEAWGSICLYKTEDQNHGNLKVVLPKLKNEVELKDWWRAIPGLTLNEPTRKFNVDGYDALYVPADGSDGKIVGWFFFEKPFPFAIGASIIQGTHPWALARTASVYATKRIHDTISKSQVAALQVKEVQK